MAELGEPLSEREFDVLNCIADSATNKEIAARLIISPNTVKVHVRNIYTKLGVSSRTEAVTAAWQQQLITLPGMPDPTPPTPEPEPTPRPEPQPEPPPEPKPTPPPQPHIAVVEPVEPAPASEPPALSADLPVSEPPRWRRGWLVAGGIVLLVLLGLAIWRLSPAGNPNTPFTETPIAETNWLTSRTMPQPRARMAVANVGLRLYQIGGQTADGIVNSVDIYATHEFSWLAGAPKLTAVADATAAVLSGEIYVPGGHLENGQPTTSVEAYSPLNDGWRPITPLPRPVAGGLALSDDQHLYLIGGQDGNAYLADVYRYALDTQIWETLAPLPTARAFSAGGVWNGRLFVVGGENETGALADCWLFDPTGGTWNPCANLQTPRSRAGATALAGRLYLIGGDQASTGEVYTISEDTWTPLPLPMLTDTSRWTHIGLVGVETRVYALGGLLDGQLANETYAYSTLSYQYYIPAAPIGGEQAP